MAKVLISFLGRGLEGGGYREADYRFPETGEPLTMTLFGQAAACHYRPDRIVLLGTTHSMWDGLYTGLGLDESDAQMAAKLRECVGGAGVSADDLRAMRGPVAQAFAEVLRAAANADDDRPAPEVRLDLIPLGRDVREQASIIQVIAQAADPGDTLWLDVTHGLRHLPMLVMLSAMYLQRVKHVRLERILYGALEMRDERGTPVLDLAGLLQIADWISAFDRFDKDLDFGVLAGLLDGHLGGAAVDQFREAAFLQRIGRIDAAAERMARFRKSTRQVRGDFLDLLLPALNDRLDAFSGTDRYARQRAACLLNLNTGDHVRALIHAYEAFVTALTLRYWSSASGGYDARQRAVERFESSEERTDAPLKAPFKRLRSLRNVVAHGEPPSGAKIEADLASAEALSQAIGEIVAILLPEQAIFGGASSTHRPFAALLKR